MAAFVGSTEKGTDGEEKNSNEKITVSVADVPSATKHDPLIDNAVNLSTTLSKFDRLTQRVSVWLAKQGLEAHG